MAFKRFFKIYWAFIKQAQQILFQSRVDFAILYLGKVLVLFFSILWVDSVFKTDFVVNGYSKKDIYVYLGIFLVLDRLIQVFFYRSLYFVQVYVKSGLLDKILTLPLKFLFYATFKVSDLNDLIMLIPSLGFLFFAISNSGIKTDLVFYVILFACLLIALILAYAILLFVASCTFHFTNVENMFLLYRDFANASRFPPEIFGSFFSFVFIFIIPIFAIFTIPAKFILGMLNFSQLGIISLVAVGLLFASVNFWNFSIKKYTSAGG